MDNPVGGTIDAVEEPAYWSEHAETMECWLLLLGMVVILVYDRMCLSRFYCSVIHRSHLFAFFYVRFFACLKHWLFERPRQRQNQRESRRRAEQIQQILCLKVRVEVNGDGLLHCLFCDQ